MSTVNDLISGAMRLIGAVDPGVGLNSDEQTDIILTLNNLIEAFNVEGLTVYSIANVTKALTASTQSYQIGTGLAINTARPIKIVGAGIVANSLRHDIEVVPAREWSKIREKGLTGNLPLKLYYDDAYPTASVNLWPIPSGTPTLDLWIWQQLAAVVNPSDALALPPAHWRALRYALALDLLPEFGRVTNANLIELIVNGTKEAKDILRKFNADNQANPAPSAAVEAAAE